MRRRMPGNTRIFSQWRGVVQSMFTLLLVFGAIALIGIWSRPQIVLVGMLLRGPQTMTVDQLVAERPSLPAYVRLSGDVHGELGYETSLARSGHSQAALALNRTPIVGSGWQEGDLVPVISSVSSSATGQSDVVGILYPLIPQENELAYPMGLDYQGKIALDQLAFSYDGRTGYFLDVQSPLVSLMPVIGPLVLVVGTFVLGLMIITLGWLARRKEARMPQKRQPLSGMPIKEKVRTRD